MKESLPAELHEACENHYKWHGERNVHAIRYIKNKNSDFKLLLVRFISNDNSKWSSLCHTQEWNDGHYDIEELFDCYREDEKALVKRFENSHDFV